MAVPVTATVITLNEAANIQAALESLSWADEIIVVDSESTDDTVTSRARFTDRVIVRPWPGYIAQKNFAADQARHDWIFSLDADERVTPELAAEIAGLMKGSPPAAGYRVPRVTFHLGRWIRSTDWYPDYQLRLYDRRRARWTGRYVHESVKADGPVSGPARRAAALRLSRSRAPLPDDGPLHHAGGEADVRGRPARRLVDLAVHPPAAFLRNYVLRGGFRDGVPGLIVSAMNARYVGLKFAKLWELCSPSTSTPRAPGAGDSNKSS